MPQQAPVSCCPAPPRSSVQTGHRAWLVPALAAYVCTEASRAGLGQHLHSPLLSPGSHAAGAGSAPPPHCNSGTWVGQGQPHKSPCSGCPLAPTNHPWVQIQQG